MLSILISLAFAAPDSSSIKTTIDTFNKFSQVQIPQLSSAQRQKLLNGEVVKTIDKGKDADGNIKAGKAIAYYISTLPKAQLWLSFQDNHFQVQENTIEYRFKSDGIDKMSWYGFMDLPWPMSDRHWVVDVWNNHSLAEKTNNAMWEHPWKLQQDGVREFQPFIDAGKVKKVSQKMYREAVYLPACDGLWAMMDLEGSTLMVYSATATVGGSIPEGLMMKLLMSNLNSFIKDGEKRAKTQVPKHYRQGGSHETMYGGDGKPITKF